MAGPVPAIHVSLADLKQDVDARLKAGHDELEGVTVRRRGTQKQHWKSPVWIRPRVAAARSRPGFCFEGAPFDEEGAGNAGRWPHPQARGLKRKGAHKIDRSAETVRHSLRSGFTTYSALSPVFGLSSHRRRSTISIDLTPASRGQDHAAWSYASDAHRLRPSASTAPRLTYRDDLAKTSLFTRRDEGYVMLFLIFGNRIIFAQRA